MRKIWFGVLAVFFLTGCGADFAKSFEKDVIGSYVGVLPAADDSGLALTLNIHEGAYTLSSKFITKQKVPTVTKGRIVYVRKNVLRIGDSLYETRDGYELRLLNPAGKRIRSKLNYSLFAVWL
ncbi:hypothetical protein NO1_1669 [Candidatus Termititenax aidoneus]|uniref:Lipoprotein n=1 Tax=Termititenax aidoneus TaxID=2218524 RepID=A0A388TCF0_TERA1|nr:hypothetical protein NO1_1669 [Candidatus Termititenax aidoneus]